MKKIAYKGFKKNLTCSNFQYEIGKKYEKENAEISNMGFPAYENPFDVLDDFEDIQSDRICEVEQYGDMKTIGNVQVSSGINITAEIGFTGLFNAGIKWIIETTNPQSMTEESAKADSVDNDTLIGSTGNNAQIESTSDYARIGSTGDRAQILSNGYRARIGSTGNLAVIKSSGYYTRIGSNGNLAQIESTGHHDMIYSSGERTQIDSIGNFAQICSTGNHTKIISTGNYAKIASSGKECIICGTGTHCKVKAGLGSSITLTEWDFSVEESRYVLVCLKTESVDGKRIKPDTWYELIDGEFIEALDAEAEEFAQEM